MNIIVAEIQIDEKRIIGGDINGHIGRKNNR